MRRASLAPISRRGFALVDAVIGGIILAIGLAVILSLGARAISMQREGEVRIIAAHLADELLSTVQMEGPTDFLKLYDTFGRYDAPFEDFEYDVVLEDRGLGYPYRVTATIIHIPTNAEYSVETLISDREGDDPNPPRAPSEPLDREARHDERGL